MDYATAQAHLRQAASRGIVPGLDAIRALLCQLGDPQRSMKFVHVAGTNGKGATTAMIAAIAIQAGIPTGRYTSPAVFSDLEKFQVNGADILPQEFADCMAEIAAAKARMAADGLRLPTPFEIETALALLFFHRRGCRLAVLETGMGGLLDATNVIEDALVCALTAIDMDHMRFLGDTLPEIAAQKAGIVKPGCAVVLEGQGDVVRAVVEAACRRVGAELTVTDPAGIQPIRADALGQTFFYGGMELFLPLAGAFQRENAAAAVEAARLLNRFGFAISDGDIRAGLGGMRWPGRLERIHVHPDVYIDGAHNPNAARRLAEALPPILCGRPLICIMGVLADKDFGEVARRVCALAEHTFTVTPRNPRALDAAALAGTISRHGSATAVHSVAEALERARRMAGEDGVILAFGSLSYLSEVKAQVKECWQ